MSKMLGKYTNGNYEVFIYNDGTKVRINDKDSLVPAFPESIDMKISNRCNMGCPFCHEESVPQGDLADLNHPILNSLHPYTELALGGGNVLEHPDLDAFLRRMKRQKVICNMTLHLSHFTENYNYVSTLVDTGLIHGLGISVNDSITDYQIGLICSIPNAVVHCIAGIVRPEALEQLRGLKLLILGYKDFGRGAVYAYQPSIQTNINWVRAHLSEMRDWFPLISFDNLAIEQLNVKELVSPDEWEKTYMGDDGQYTMYVDLVKKEFAVSSVSPRLPIGEETDIRKLFEVVRK